MTHYEDSLLFVFGTDSIPALEIYSMSLPISNSCAVTFSEQLFFILMKLILLFYDLLWKYIDQQYPETIKQKFSYE